MGSGLSTGFRYKSRRLPRTSATSGRRSPGSRTCSRLRWSMALEHGDDLVGDDGIAFDDPADLPSVLGPVAPNQDAFGSLLDLDAAGITIDDEAEPHGHLPRGGAGVRPRTKPRFSIAGGRWSGRTSVARSRRPPRRFPRSVAPTARGFGSVRRGGGRPPWWSTGFP